MWLKRSHSQDNIDKIKYKFVYAITLKGIYYHIPQNFFKKKHCVSLRNLEIQRVL